MAIIGTPGNDVRDGTLGDDVFRLWQGGDDSATGRAGDDTFFLRDALTAADHIDGGQGSDKVVLNGDYSLTLNQNTLVNINTLQLGGDHVYDLTTKDHTVAAGKRMVVSARQLGASGHLDFDGSAELDGSYKLVGSGGNDDLTGGALGDRFLLGAGGNDTAHGGGGDDVFRMFETFDESDTIDGGPGTDTVTLTGIGVADFITLTATTLLGVEEFVLIGGAGINFGFGTVDATVAAGATLTVDASAVVQQVTFDGALESDGHFAFVGGSGPDRFTGGALADTFDLTLGDNDSADGGGGADTFNLGAALTSADEIDGGAGSDTLSLNGDYAALSLSAIAPQAIDGIETVLFGTGHDYSVSVVNDITDGSATLNIDASALGATDTLDIDLTAATSSGYSATGGAGGDTFTFAGNFHTTDTVNGGGGSDTVSLSGVSGSDSLIFSATTFLNVEHLILLSGFVASILSNDATVAAGATLEVDGSASYLYFNGGAETDGSFSFKGGVNADTVTGGAGGDTFAMGALAATDSVNGGAGYDTLNITDMVENASDTLAFSATTITGIDRLVATADVNFDLRTNDANVAAGATMDVDMSALATSSLNWDGGFESDGHFNVTSGAAGGYITGGALSDTIALSAHTAFFYVSGRGGADDITCNTGLEQLVYGAASDSANSTYDLVHAFSASADKFDLTTTVASVTFLSTEVNSGDVPDAMGAAINDQMVAGDAFAITANAGDLIGHVFLVVDGDGNSAYDPATDYLIDISGYTGTLDTGDFI